MEGGTCPVCYAGTFELMDGMLVCDACGNVNQSFTQETQEFQEGISDGRMRQISLRASQQDAAQPAKEREPLPIEKGVGAYIEALNQLQQRLAKALIDHLQLNAHLEHIIQEIWLKFLGHSQVLEPAFIKAVDIKVNSRLETLRATAEHQTVMMFVGSSSRMVGNELNRVIPPTSTLIILQLACWYAREAVSPLDIVRLCLSGVLPYSRFAADSQELLQPYKTVLPGRLITLGVPNPSTMYNRSIEMVTKISLQCPKINGALWLQRYAHELGLPEVVVPLAVKLEEIYTLPTGGPELAYFAKLHPWAQTMAVLIVAVRLLYGLGGGSSQVPVNVDLPEPPQWTSWAANTLAKFGGLLQLPLNAEEAARLPSHIFAKYLDNLRSTVFCGFSTVETLEEANSWFIQLANQLNDPTGERLQTPSMDTDHADSRRTYELYPKSILSAAVSPDYAALLTVCSAFVWLTPQALHTGVGQIERAIIESESFVSYSTDIIEQAKLLRIKQETEILRQERQQYQLKVEEIKASLGLQS